ncbi:MAG TPA: cytochrome P450 [Solirubrobacterales bacterium]|nr:cytochrome P450 [Solirubrobacterales bacterium]
MTGDPVDLLLSDLGEGSDFSGLLQTLLPDPYGLYASVRPSTPLRLDDLKAVVLARYPDAEAVLSDPSYRLIHPRDERIDPLSLDDEDPVAKVLRDEIEPCVLFMPPERHAVVRRHLQKALKEDSPQRRQEVAREMAGVVLDALEGETIDVVGDLAVPVPTFTAARSFGLPQEDWPLLLDWAGGVGRWLEMFVSPEQMARSAEAIVAARGFFDGALEERAGGSGEGDILAGLAARETEGLEREEALSGCLHFMAASATTTVGALSNALVALARHPDQWALVVADPGLAGAAVEEAIRWDPPNQAILRIASEAGEIGGVAHEEGDLMVALVAAANRDPDRWEDPDRFDLRRERRRHLGFGAGSHFCSGAQLGRATATGVVEALAERVEEMSVDRGLLEWSDTLAQRQLDFAPLAIRRKGA